MPGAGTRFDGGGWGLAWIFIFSRVSGIVDCRITLGIYIYIYYVHTYTRMYTYRELIYIDTKHDDIIQYP